MENNAIYNPDSRNGWISVRRAMRFHPIVGMGKPVAPADAKRGSFSRYEAWQDLLMMACHAPSEWMNKGRKVTLGVGQLGGAYSFLADRWNWTVKQVRGFLEKLIGDTMVEKEAPEDVKNDDQLHSRTSSEPLPKKGKQSNNLVQTITICNYSTYQVAAEIHEIQKGQAKGKRRASEGHDSSNKETREQDRSPIGDSSSAAPSDPPQFDLGDQPAKLTASVAAREAFAIYNATAKKCGLPIARVFDKGRAKDLALRVKDAGGLEGFRQAMANIERSAFLRGQTDKPFKADLNFVCQRSSFIRLLEGGYGNGAHSQGAAAGGKYRQAYQHLVA